MTAYRPGGREVHIPLSGSASEKETGSAPGPAGVAPRAFGRFLDTFGIPVVGRPPGRDLAADAIRGLAILLVVLGHAISNAIDLNHAARSDPLFILSNFIYTFHMPLFMAVAGYVLYARRIRVLDRATRLLLPFFAWIPVYWFVNRYLRHFPWPVRFGTTLKDTVLRPGAGLWFLPTLFLCTLLLLVAVRLEKVRWWLGEVSLAAMFVGVNFIPYDNLGLVQVKYFFFFFAAGYLLAKHRPRLERFSPGQVNAALALASAVFLGLFALFYRGGALKPYLFPITLPDLFKTPGTYLVRYLMAVLGVFACVALVRALGRGAPGNALAWFGLVTMDIYVAHGLMVQLAFGGGWVKVLAGFVLGVVLSLVLTLFFLRQWWVTAMVFLGIRPERNASGGTEPPAEESPPRQSRSFATIQSSFTRRIGGPAG